MNETTTRRKPATPSSRGSAIPRAAALALALAAWTPAAFAHVPGLLTGGFGAGFLHPFTGIDHLLVILAIGIWSQQLSGHAPRLIPPAFLAAMAAGAYLGHAGLALPFGEAAVAGSVLLCGVLIAARVRMPLAAGTGLAVLIALLHGHAHGVEIPAAVSASAFTAGFTAATALLLGGAQALWRLTAATCVDPGATCRSRPAARTREG